MTKERDSLLDRDWAAAWDTLPEAPALVPRALTTQVTLRLPSSLVARLKRVAGARTLPYHALARSWIVDALRDAVIPGNTAQSDEPNAEQLNIKLDQDILDLLKVRADKMRRPYHRLAREWIETALGREEKNLGLDPSPGGHQPAIKDLMVLLLHSTSNRGDDAIRGVTRLQKLVFVIEQQLAAQRSHFYAFNYGPFNEEVNDAAEALRLAGFLRGTKPTTPGPPSFDDMMATAAGRQGPRDQDDDVEEFSLSENGHAAAERLRKSNRAYQQLYARIGELRKEWDTADLVERVYQTYPKYAEKSLIRDKVARRTGRRPTEP
jgi:predicted DNA binding CopG/RHH family protein/uncharacterized protein YwgA